jgi:hypothetical protein
MPIISSLEPASKDPISQSSLFEKQEMPRMIRGFHNLSILAQEIKPKTAEKRAEAQQKSTSPRPPRPPREVPREIRIVTPKTNTESLRLVDGINQMPKL